MQCCIVFLLLRHKTLGFRKSLWCTSAKVPGEQGEKRLLRGLVFLRTIVSIHGCHGWYKKWLIRAPDVKFASFYYPSCHWIDGVCLSVTVICRAKVIIICKSLAIGT